MNGPDNLVSLFARTAYELSGGRDLDLFTRPGNPHSRSRQVQLLQARRGVPGGLIHEVGGCRVGTDAKAGVLHSFCQAHDAGNLYVFGGGALVTSGDTNPRLTIRAVTARGCDHLLDGARRGEV